MIRLVIASDNRLYREAIANLLVREDISIVAISPNTARAVESSIAHKPDVVLLDMTMENACKVVSELADQSPPTKVIALAMNEDADSILDCAKRGVAGYLTRNASYDHLISAINGVADGELFCPKKIAQMLFEKVSSLHFHGSGKAADFDDPSSKSNIPLTHREQQIASLIKRGKSNKEIARELQIGLSTVKNHVHNILTKMGVRNRVQAVSRL